jgi:hypothetical protein
LVLPAVSTMTVPIPAAANTHVAVADVPPPLVLLNAIVGCVVYPAPAFVRVIDATVVGVMTAVTVTVPLMPDTATSGSAVYWLPLPLLVPPPVLTMTLASEVAVSTAVAVAA